jgi:protein SCO1/2
MTAFRLSLTTLLALLVLAPLSAEAAPAKKPQPPLLEGVGFDQELNAQVPLDLQFVDETGTPVKLCDYFGEKPVILVLAYYQCPRLCNLVLNGLVQGMLETPFTVGEEFNVVTVSFDPRETWRLAAEKKKSYLRRYAKPGAAGGWHFLTGEQPQIKRLTDSVGFHYKYDPQKDQYVHASGIMILTPQGRVSRYFYDVRYPGRDLRLGLVEASQSKIGSPVDQILLYCFHYDPAVGRYSASVMAFIRIGGVLTVLAVGGLFWMLMRGRRRNEVLHEGAGGTQQRRRKVQDQGAGASAAAEGGGA